MKRTEKTEYIESALHNVIMTARLIVEEGGATRDEIAEFLTKKSNEEFTAVFDAPERIFMMMAIRDLLEGLSSLEVKDMFGEGDDVDESA